MARCPPPFVIYQVATTFFTSVSNSGVTLRDLIASSFFSEGFTSGKHVLQCLRKGNKFWSHRRSSSLGQSAAYCMHYVVLTLENVYDKKEKKLTLLRNVNKCIYYYPVDLRLNSNLLTLMNFWQTAFAVTQTCNELQANEPYYTL